MSIRFGICLLICLLSSAAIATNVKRCKNDEPFPLSVDIEGCEEPPCDIVKGTTAVMNVHFVGTKHEIKKLTAQVRATTLGITVPYDLPDEVADVCSNLKYEAQCPIYATEDVVYKFNFYIDYLYPEIGVKVQISLVDEEDDSIACFSTDIKVKKGATENKLLS